MMRGYAAGLPVLAGILANLCVRPALADELSCSAVVIEADASVRTRWPRLLNHILETFEARDDIDRCARVELRMRDASITVEAILPDGRSAARTVSRREDVVPTLEALLLLPERIGQETPALEPSASAAPPASAMSVPPSGPSAPGAREVPSGRALGAADRDASAASAVRRPGHLRIELSAITGARIGDGRTGVGLGAFSFLDLSGWLVGFEGRADRYKTLSEGMPDGGVLELAVLGGRRLRFENIALDLVAGAAAVLQGTTRFERSSPTTGGSVVTASSSSTVPRLLLGARVNFSALSTLHTFVGLDGELGPPRAGDGADIPDEPRLPVWTVGLALGATVGTQ
jgi:hypothetical protein